jgi:hypothetical protein
LKSATVWLMIFPGREDGERMPAPRVGTEGG